MKFGCISAKLANENQFIILKELQKDVHSWPRGQDASPLRPKKPNLVLVHP